MRSTSYARIIAAIVTGSVSAATACGGSTEGGATPTTDAGPVDGSIGDSALADGAHEAALRPGFVPVECGRNGPSLQALTVTPAFDYVELRTQDGYQQAKPDAVVESVGTLCDHTTDVAACKTKFAAINRPVKQTCSVPYPCQASYLAYTRGDEVATVLPDDDLTKLATPIDSIGEAAFVLSWARGFSCDGSSYRTTSDGFDVAYSTTSNDCPSSTREHHHDILVHVTRDGVITTLEDVDTVIEHPETGCAAARLASDVTYELPTRVSDVGDWLAAAAHLEAASVASFARLARELSSHGAPALLVARAAEAAREERRHARALRALARAHGKRVAPAPRISGKPRTLEAIAIENAVEGATRETWGAVVVAYQARTATSPTLRSTFGAIARDEASHAELAADVDTWITTRLGPGASARASAARCRAVDAIAKHVEAPPLPDAVRRTLGLPAGDDAKRLWSGACEQLFAPS